MANKKLYTLGKNERLKSRKMIEQLFKEGTTFSIFPLRVVYLPINNNGTSLQSGFTVSTRHFKKAVHRNRIKRQIKEAYRLQKIELQQALQQQQRSLVLVFMYIGNELPAYSLISNKMKAALHRLKKIGSETD